MTVKQSAGIYTDAESQVQIARFRAYEIVAARPRNEDNLKRWSDGLRERWEAEHVGGVTSMSRDEWNERQGEGKCISDSR